MAADAENHPGTQGNSEVLDLGSRRRLFQSGAAFSRARSERTADALFTRCDAAARSRRAHHIEWWNKGWPHEFGQWNSGLLHPTSSRHSCRDNKDIDRKKMLAVVRATKRHRRHPDAAPGRGDCRSSRQIPHGGRGTFCRMSRRQAGTPRQPRRQVRQTGTPVRRSGTRRSGTRSGTRRLKARRSGTPVNNRAPGRE
jgi:hypothetical protein